MFAKKSNQSMIAKNRLNSTWTPLSNEETNNKIFDERRALVGKWYDKWTDEQRRRILEDLLLKSKPRQLEHAREIIRERVPAAHRDFTRVLPRVISLYIFSFLDPRSLSRCSRVCWYWHYLTELDQLWMPKCLKLGWYLTFTPSPFEVGVWKRNYTENIRTLQVLRPREPPYVDLEQFHISGRKEEKRGKSKGKSATPWRGSDPVPTDTWRYNYLENDDVVEVVNKLRKRNYYGKEAKVVSHAAKSKVNTGQHSMTAAQRSQSLSRLHTMNYSSATSPDRPVWAQSMTSMNGAAVNGYSTDVPRPHPTSPTHRPSAPVPRKPASRPITARSSRDPPTSQLFPSKPWEVTEMQDSD